MPADADRATYLLPIAERTPLAWIIATQSTAIAAHRATYAARLATGDRLLLYTTRGCFHNPTRDRGRIIGEATVTEPARLTDPPVRFGTAEFPYLVKLEITTLAPLREGVDLSALVPTLPGTFPNAGAWSVWLRRPLVPVDPADAAVLREHLAAVAGPYAANAGTYAGLAA